MTTRSKRPDMTAYFRGRIDWHVNGIMARRVESPRDVAKVEGDVTDPLITVTMRDGSSWQYEGGRYASRKVNLCYAPLMPRPVTTKDIGKRLNERLGELADAIEDLKT